MSDKSEKIKTWGERCEYFDDGHIMTHADIQRVMQDEIDELREELAQRGGVPAEPTQEMVDAARALILYGETPGRTTQGAREHVRMSGDSIECWPDWAKTENGHLTKAGLAILIWRMMYAAAPAKVDDVRRYSPEELLNVARNTLLPCDTLKRKALMTLIDALERPDLETKTPVDNGLYGNPFKESAVQTGTVASVGASSLSGVNTTQPVATDPTGVAPAAPDLDAEIEEFINHPFIHPGNRLIARKFISQWIAKHGTRAQGLKEAEEICRNEVLSVSEKFDEIHLTFADAIAQRGRE